MTIIIYGNILYFKSIYMLNKQGITSAGTFLEFN